MNKDTINEWEDFFTESETAVAGAEAVAETGTYQAESPWEREQTAVNGKKCSACGDNLQFDPTSGRLKCRSCGTVQDIFVARGEEMDFATLGQGDKSWVEETHVYHCSNCNAEDVLSKREIARVCPFCGSPSVVEREEFSALRPNAVLPFALDKEKATEHAKKWAKGRFFAPKEFKTYFQPENMNGVYLPAFTFDAQSDSFYSGTLGKHYYRTVRRNGKTVQVRHTRYFPVSGRYPCSFDDLAVNATDAVPQNMMETLLAYDYANSVEYREDFLYGFSALLYTKDGAACWNEAKEQANGSIRSGVLSQYHHDVVSHLDIRTNFFNMKYRYLLLPMYICNYAYKGKTYPFYVNGRNGKTKGKSPVSALKVGLTVLAGIAALALIGVLAYFLG